MFRFAKLRTFCVILAFVTVVGIYIPFPEQVNDLMEMGEWVTELIATAIAYVRDKDYWIVESILKDKLGFDRTLVFSMIALWYSGMFDWHHRFTHLYRTLIALVLAHLFLAFCWIEDGNTTLWWYKGHEAWIRQVLKDNKWHYVVTFATVVKLYHLVIFAYALGVATLVVRFFHYVWLGGKWYMRRTRCLPEYTY